MTREDNHLLCLGLMSRIVRKEDDGGYTAIEEIDREAIREAIKSAERLGLPVSLARFDMGLRIYKDTR